MQSYSHLQLIACTITETTVRMLPSSDVMQTSTSGGLFEIFNHCTLAVTACSVTNSHIQVDAPFHHAGGYAEGEPYTVSNHAPCPFLWLTSCAHIL